MRTRSPSAALAQALIHAPTRRATLSPQAAERLRKLALGLFLFVPLAYALIQTAWSAIVFDAPGFVRQQALAIGAAVPGRVDQVLVRAGQTVAAGQPLARVRDAQGGITVVHAPVAGRIAGIDALRNDQLPPGRRLLRLLPATADTHIDAWIPQRHAGDLAPGARASVLLADGEWRDARVATVPEDGHPLPAVLAGSFGPVQPGILVRLDLEEAGARPGLDDGSRVKVRFGDPRRAPWMTEVRRWFDGAEQGRG